MPRGFPRRGPGRGAAPPPLLHAPPAGTDPHPFRIVPRNHDDGILPIGLPSSWWGDVYHHALTLSWSAFLGFASAIYLVANVAFAALYLLGAGSIGNARPGAFSDAFFFSVQTMATIGYGQMSPASFYGNVLVTIETLFGLILLAITTGLVFARFSRPTARVLFSRVCVIGPHGGVPTLAMRLANERRNQVSQAEVAVTLVRDETSPEGEYMRRFYDLALARDKSPIFPMSFMVLHPIDESSPLWGATPASLERGVVEIVVTVSGLDETLSQTIHARTSYLAHEVRWNHRFADVLGWTRDGRRAVDYRRFHDTEPL